MAVVIRMKRSGRRNRPCYRISVADSRDPRDGRTLESLGLYDPIARSEEMQVKLDVDRARYWVEQGARPSETVASIFKRLGVISSEPKPKRDRSGRKKPTQKHARRKAAKTERATAKSARRDERRTAAAEARKAAAAEAPAEG